MTPLRRQSRGARGLVSILCLAGCGEVAIPDPDPACAADADCTPAHTCQAGKCIPFEHDECVRATDCVKVPACHVADGVTCPNGLCVYAVAKAGVGCDDDDVCTEKDSCNDTGLCAGTHRTLCDHPKCVGAGDCPFPPGTHPECFVTDCTDGYCDWRPQPRVECAAVRCGDGFLYAKRFCGVDGTCPSPEPNGDSCGGFACADPLTCLTECEENTDCAGELRCKPTGDCEPPLDLGGACTVDGECTSGHCVDGVCCETACDGACMACGAAGKCDVAPADDVACGVIDCPADTACRDFEPDLTTARCAGLGRCRKPEDCTFTNLPTSTVCRAAAGTCDVPESCDGAGACPSDTFEPATKVCRSAANACDVSEFCDGSSATCPTDVVLASGDVTGSLSVGTPSTISFACGAQKARLTFSANAGASLGVDLSSVTIPGGGSVTVQAPNGASLISSQAFATVIGTGVRLGTLTQSGTYTVVITPAGELGGTLSIAVWSDVSGPLVLGEPATPNIQYRGQQARLTFSGNAGQFLGVDVAQPTYAGTLSVQAPNGATIVSQAPFQSAGVGVRTGQLTQSGTYVVVVVPASAATGTMKLTAWSDVGGTLPINAQQAVTVTYPNQQVRMNFSANAGESLGIDLSGLEGIAGGTLNVFAPNGASVINQTPFTSFAGVGAALGILTQSGTYTVVVAPGAAATGTLKLVVFRDVPQALVLNQPYAMELPWRTQKGRLVFSGNAGEFLGIDVAGVTLSSGGTIGIFAPNGASVINQTTFPTSSGVGVRTGQLTQSGTYTVVITPTGGLTGAASVTLWRDVPGQFVTGVQNTVSVPFRNQYVRMNFSANAGEFLGVDVADAAFGGTINLFAPNGASVINQTAFTSGVGVRTGQLTQSGTYTVVVTPTAGATGNVRLTLWTDVPGSLVAGPQTDVAVLYPNQWIRKVFSANAGENLGLDVASITGFDSGTINLFAPNGANVINQTPFTTTAGIGVATGTLTQSGTYTVVIAPVTAGTGTLKLALYADVPGSLVLGTDLTLTIPYRTQKARPVFSGNAGENRSLVISGVTLSSGGVVDIFAPNGASVIAQTAFTTSGITISVPTLTQSGTYTVRVTPTGGLTGGVTVRLAAR